MTDKEQIMIDGVDVSGCEYACNTAFGKNGCKHPMMKNIYCSKNPNCYFKQLSRKTQECESLKEEIEVLKDNFDTATRDCNELIEELKQECEELKEEYEAVKSESFTREELITLQEKDIDRYRKALEEIERELKEDIYCESQECGCDDYEECLRCTKNIILDIINNTKKEDV